MPLLKSSIKAARKTRKMTEVNRSAKNKLKAAEKHLLTLKDVEKAVKLLKTLIPQIQRAGLKNLIPKNTAARKISRYTRYVAKLKK